MKNIRFFLSENFMFLEVKFSIYLNRRVFVMANCITCATCKHVLKLKIQGGRHLFFSENTVTSYYYYYYYYYYYLKR